MRETIEEPEGIDCLSGQHIRWNSRTGASTALRTVRPESDLPFIGPGLVDLQVNGVDGVDFNDPSLTEVGLLNATRYLLSQGVTTFFPTIITHSTSYTRRLLGTISVACARHPLLQQCIGGIHLEGPFVSKVDGARGAHDKKHVKKPDWELFMSFQKAAGNRIRLITLSPEWDNSSAFITACRRSGVLVSIGHSHATPEQIGQAVAAGATLSTHIGNAIPLMLPRHPNILWEQLAQEALYPGIIADGFHVPDSFIKVVLQAKGKKCFLVSDVTYFSGMKPGIYPSPIGKEVLLEKNGRLSMQGGGGLLAGATSTLRQNVEYLLSKKLAKLDRAWQMASVIPWNLASPTGSRYQKNNHPDRVVFRLSDNRIYISKVFKAGRLVFEA